MTPVDKVVDALRRHGCDPRRSGDKWTARCPAHDDRNPSLTVGEGADGQALVHCHAGCPLAAVLAELELTKADLFPDHAVRERTRVVAEYPYLDEHGALLYTVRRVEPGRNGERKSFYQVPASGRTGAGAMGGVRRVLFRLPELLASAGDEPVYIAEGEKDVLALEAAGCVATCNAGGAGTWSSVAEQARRVLADAPVVVVADRDDSGYRHAADVAGSLADVARSVTVVVAAVGKDASDHLGAGRTVEELEVVASTDLGLLTGPAVTLADWLQDSGGRAAADHDDADGGTGPFGYTAVTLADVAPEEVRWLWPGRLPVGKVVVLDGDPAVGKSTLILDVAARLTTCAAMPDGCDGPGPADVVVLSAEDGLADTIRPRLDAAGADPARVHALTDITVSAGEAVERRLPVLPDDVDQLEQLVRRTSALLVIVDVLMAYLSPDTNSYRDQDVRRALAPLWAMAERCGCCVVVLRHLRKASTASAVYAGGGSIGIVGAARVGLMAGFDPDDGDVDEADRRRVLAVVKCNLDRKAASLGYRAVSGHNRAGRIEWLGEVRHRADDLVDRDSHDDERNDKEAFLRDLLADGPVRYTVVEKAAGGAGWSVRQLRAALKRLGGRSVKSSFGGGWDWTLAPEDDAQDVEDDHIQKRSSSASSCHLGDDPPVGGDGEDDQGGEDDHAHGQATSAPSGHLRSLIDSEFPGSTWITTSSEPDDRFTPADPTSRVTVTPQPSTTPDDVPF